MALDSLWAPLRFEIPPSFQFSTTAFGMGERAASNLVGQLESSAEPLIIVFGSAGALDPTLRPGDAFIISSVQGPKHGPQITENISRAADFLHLPQAPLYTSKTLLKTARDKLEVYQTNGCRLVDMEMAYLWAAASPSLRQRLLFVRCVIDGQSHGLDFSSRLGALKLLPNWLRYIQGMNRLLKSIVHQ